MTDDDEPLLEVARFGTQCKDTGACHHRCSAQSGCFREQSCAPLSYALAKGMDMHWRTPAQQAAHQAQALSDALGSPTTASTPKAL